MKKTLELILAIASISAFASTTNIVRMTPLATFVAGTNAVLVAANRYTDEHGGSGSGISASVAGTIATNTVDAKVAPWAMKGQPQPGGGGVDTNAVKDIVHEVVDPYTESRWMRPDDWCVDYVISNQDMTSVSSYKVTRADYRTMSNVNYRVVTGRGGHAFGKILDPYSMLVMNVSEWKSMTPGLSIDGDGNFSASADGLYRIRAAWSNCYNFADVAVQVLHDVTYTRNFYLSDDAGSVRKRVNDDALAVLNAATSNSTHTCEGVKYTLYNTFTPRMTSPGAGNVKAWAVSAHVLASANHYRNKITGYQTFTDGNGNSATVKKLRWINLEEWALENMTNQFTAAEIKQMVIGDIDMIICEKTTAVPDGCIPYFVNKNKAVEWFGNDMSGVATWSCVQDHSQAIPSVSTGDRFYAISPGYLTYGYCRSDIRDRLEEMGRQYPIHSGDSGKPTFFVKDGQTVVFTANTNVGGWQGIISGFPAIKAFVNWYGDTLKEAN